MRRIEKWGAIVLVACGARTGLDAPVHDGGGPIDASIPDVARPMDAPYDVLSPICPETSLPPPPEDAGCVNLACAIPTCTQNRHTTLTGRAFAPNGALPLYDVVVYVPNAPVQAFSSGPVCSTCQASLSGHPLAVAQTDAQGRFVLTDVPVGANIPVVVQIGKWRRQVTLSIPNACADNTVADGVLRLPRNQSEGDIPHVALATGCDPVQNILTKLGVQMSELSGPSGGGRVHVYTGHNGAQLVGGQGDAYALWANLAEMMTYDVILAACECAPYPRNDNGPAYDNVYAYLAGGGRFFASHYQLNFFADAAAKLDFQTAAKWHEWGTCGMAPYLINTSFPKGKAMADWLFDLFPNTTYGQLQIQACIVEDILGTTTGVSVPWITEQKGAGIGYVSITTPPASPPDQRCGRAVVTDLHVGTMEATLTEQEAALVFMLFDLGTCVQDDTKPPKTPCSQ
jgi:hypothetical protein